MSKTTDLPEISHREVISQQFIDSTPDGGYALRILRAFRRRCDCHWIISGVHEEAAALWEQMNRDQEKRVAELDQAISILEAAAATAPTEEPAG